MNISRVPVEDDLEAANLLVLASSISSISPRDLVHMLFTSWTRKMYEGSLMISSEWQYGEVSMKWRQTVDLQRCREAPPASLFSGLGRNPRASNISNCILVMVECLCCCVWDPGFATFLPWTTVAITEHQIKTLTSQIRLDYRTFSLTYQIPPEEQTRIVRLARSHTLREPILTTFQWTLKKLISMSF